MPKAKMMSRRVLAVAVAYSFAASLALEALGWIFWLGGVLWPAVVLSPIIVVLARRRSSVAQMTEVLLASLVATLLGYTVAFGSFRTGAEVLALITALVPAAYSAVVLTLVVTTLALVADKPAADRDRKSFSFSLVWLRLVIVASLAEVFVFASTAKACRDFFWGFLGILYSPLMLRGKPVLAVTIGVIIAIFGSGVLAKRVGLRPRAIAAALVALAATIAIAALVLTPSGTQPCSPL